MTEHRRYLWDTPREWLDDLPSHRKEGFFEWLLDTYVNHDMIHEYFQKDMDEDGYFVGWPTDENWPLRQDTDNPGSGSCTHCHEDFDEGDRVKLETGKYTLKCVPCNDTSDKDECPVRAWIKSKKRVPQ